MKQGEEEERKHTQFICKYNIPFDWYAYAIVDKGSIIMCKLFMKFTLEKGISNNKNAFNK